MPEKRPMLTKWQRIDPCTRISLGLACPGAVLAGVLLGLGLVDGLPNPLWRYGPWRAALGWWQFAAFSLTLAWVEGIRVIFCWFPEPYRPERARVSGKVLAIPPIH